MGNPTGNDLPQEGTQLSSGLLGGWDMVSVSILTILDEVSIASAAKALGKPPGSHWDQGYRPPLPAPPWDPFLFCARYGLYEAVRLYGFS